MIAGRLFARAAPGAFRRAALGVRRFASDVRAVVMVEMALMLPLLILIGIGGAEIARWILLEQKISRTAAVVVDLFSQEGTITASQGDDYLIASSYTMLPFTLGSTGILFVTSITNNSGTLSVDWQLSTGSLSATSKFGVKGSTVAPALVGATLSTGQSIVAAELYYNYTPLFYSGLYHPSTPLYKTAYFRPRVSTKVTCSSGC